MPSTVRQAREATTLLLIDRGVFGRPGRVFAASGYACLRDSRIGPEPEPDAAADAGPAAAGADAGPQSAPAGPQPTPHLISLRPVDETPTEVTDYALLSVAYGVLLAGTAVSAREREPIAAAELPTLAAATFTLSKLIVHEKVETWIRRPFVEEEADGKRPKGRRLRYAVGELLSCTRCTGAWSALALVGLRLHSPATGRTVASVLAASAGNDMLHAVFSWLCARASVQEREAEEAHAGAVRGPRAVA